MKQNKIKLNADKEGYFGEFGGSYIPEMLYPNIEELQKAFEEIVKTDEFNTEFRTLLRQYAGRPSALYYAKNLSSEYGMNVYLKREDLNHTGSHKINNVIGQVILAKKLGKKRIIAETGAGQHGVATATVCALFDLPCIIYMGKIDTERQSRNVDRMRMLGATVIPVTSGSQVLKDATNEAMRDWIANPHDTHYVIGSAVGPHPFPSMVSHFQSIISEELRSQFKEISKKENPDFVVACVGGGSNAIGGFYHYVDINEVALIGVEAGGSGVDTEFTAATIAVGDTGILHGSKTVLYQDNKGQVMEAHSISAGLDYPGIGPQHAFLNSIGRVQYVNVTDQEAIEAGRFLIKREGIIPALESAHALAFIKKMSEDQKYHGKDVVVILSGNGEKDLGVYHGIHKVDSHAPVRASAASSKSLTSAKLARAGACESSDTPNRLTTLFKTKSQNILSIFVTAGYPHLDSTKEIVLELARQGVDLVEIGIPFSDPIADGQTIQETSKIALSNGVDIDQIFESVIEIRKESQIPIVLMGYYNPVFIYGFDKFLKRAKEVGIDGVILPDMPPSEYQSSFKEKFEKLNLSMIFLITSETSHERIKLLDNLSSGFLYAVSSAGTTGAVADIDQGRINYLQRLKSMQLKNPILVGFGISNREQMNVVGDFVSGVIIGSAFLKALHVAPSSLVLSSSKDSSAVGSSDQGCIVTKTREFVKKLN